MSAAAVATTCEPWCASHYDGTVAGLCRRADSVKVTSQSAPLTVSSEKYDDEPVGSVTMVVAACPFELAPAEAMRLSELLFVAAVRLGGAR